METLAHLDPAFADRLGPALAASRFLKRELGARAWLAPLLAETLDAPIEAGAMEAFLAREAADEASLKPGLRRLRSWVICQLAARDLLGLAPLAEVMEGMTRLAEVAVRHAYAVQRAALAARHGEPLGSDGRPMQMIVIGMGKLGGRELNVSSDIDLIFVYPEDGETAGQRPLSHFEFFTRLGRQIINAIGEITADGFVFRVDMRLRPNGDSGPLVSSFESLETYFIAQGREWERFAWIKARALTGERLDELAAIVRPFVFRKYLDFGAINALRALHAQIRAQVARREMADNIKLGPGGIREIEFTAQVFQIIRGGRDTALQVKPTVAVLRELDAMGLLEPGTADDLIEAYDWLRRLEHRLQYLDDAQTHDLPKDPADRARIAAAMGYADEAAMHVQLAAHRAKVSACFQAACGDPNEGGHELDDCWFAADDREQAGIKLGELGFRDAPAAAERLAQLREGSRYRQMPDGIRQRIDALVPRILQACGNMPNPDETLARTLNLIETISKRAAYLALLQQYPEALRRVLEVCSASPWAAEYLGRHPLLLDELLDSRELDTAPDYPAFAAELHEQLERAGDDVERQMDLMREQHHTQVFRLLHQDLAGRWEVEAIGDHLSLLADIVLEETLRLCWNRLAKRHRDTPAFAVIGYGKLGGKELGYASDLDIIFLYEDEAPEAATAYARLAQRCVTWLSARTPAGILFETDTRLRPNGESGFLVSSMDAFRHYQTESAWVWEHQALTRARFVAGDKTVGAAFEAERERILRQPRDREKLAEEVLAMRRRMLDQHASKSADRFSLKSDIGGLVDLEFIIQYLVLAHSHEHPRLVGNLGNIALARIAGELGLIDPARAQAAADAYRTLRRLQHRVRLSGESGHRIAPEEVVAERAAITALWMEVFGKPA